MKPEKWAAIWDKTTPSPEAKKRMFQNILTAQNAGYYKKKQKLSQKGFFLIPAASLCIFCLLILFLTPFSPFNHHISQNSFTDAAPYGAAFQEVEGTQPPDMMEAGGAEGATAPTEEISPETAMESLEETENIVLTNSVGLTAYYTDALKAEGFPLTGKTESPPYSSEEVYQKEQIIVRGSIVSLKSFVVYRDDGSLFPNFGTVMTIQVSHVLQGISPSQDRIAVVLPQAAYQEVENGRKFSASNSILESLQEGEEGIFLLASSEKEKVEEGTTFLYWQDFGEYVLYDPESLFLQTENKLLYSEKKFPGMPSEASFKDVEQYLEALY